MIEAFGGEKNASDLLVVSSPSSVIPERRTRRTRTRAENRRCQKRRNQERRKWRGRGENNTAELDDGAEMTTIDGNGGSDVAMDDGSGDKKEPVAVARPPQRSRLFKSSKRKQAAVATLRRPLVRTHSMRSP